MVDQYREKYLFTFNSFLFKTISIHSNPSQFRINEVEKLILVLESIGSCVLCMFGTVNEFSLEQHNNNNNNSLVRIGVGVAVEMAVRILIKNSISPVDAANESDGRYC